MVLITVVINVILVVNKFVFSMNLFGKILVKNNVLQIMIVVLIVMEENVYHAVKESNIVLSNVLEIVKIVSAVIVKLLKFLWNIQKVMKTWDYSWN